MSFLDELKDEIMTWIDDDQDPDCIREDIIKTVEEAIAQAPKRKARHAIAAIAKEYAEGMYGELATSNYGEEEYLQMADMFLNTMDAAFNELQNTVVNTTANKTAKTQEDQDAETILTFLNNLDRQKQAKKAAQNSSAWAKKVADRVTLRTNVFDDWDD